MAMLPGLRPLRETLDETLYPSIAGGYSIYVQDDKDVAEARTYYIAKWMKLAAGTYTLNYFIDDSGTMSIDGVQQFAMGAGPYAPPAATQTFTVATNGVYRWDFTYNEGPGGTPSFLAYALYLGTTLIEVSRANDWIGDIVPIPDSALGTKPAYNEDARLSYPIFIWEPDWTNSVIERLEWNTDVLTSESGAEQRRKLRQFPRRSVEASFIAHGNQRAMIDNYITGVGTSNGLVPLWYDRSIVTSASVAGAVDLFADIALRDFNVNDVVIIRYGNDRFDYELNIVAAVQAGQLVLAYGLQNEVPVGASVTPVRVARMLDMPNGTNLTDRVRQYSIRFSTTEVANVDAQWNFPIYARTNLPILTLEPNYKDTMQLTFERNNYTWDNEIGNIYSRDPGGQAFTGLQFTYHVHGRQEMLEMKQLLYKLSGRWREIHIPSGQDDLVLAADIAATGSLTCYRSGYQQFDTVSQNVRRDILIQLWDGTLLPNTVISARVVGDTELLFLSETIAAIPMSEVRRISYMSRGRLDMDAIEITRLTDSDGASQIPLTFRTMSERRDAPAVTFE